MSLQVRAIDPADTDGIAAYARVRSAVAPEDADTPEQARWEDATYPGQVTRLLALADGEAAGTATTGRLHIYAPEHERFYLGAWVLPAWRRRGIGSALYGAASDTARSAGKTGFHTWVSVSQGEGVRFLESRGFFMVGRDKAVGLDLRGMVPPDPDLPDRFRLETLAHRPDLVVGVHDTAVEAYPSIPSATPIDPGSLEEFIARDVDRVGVPREAFFVALDIVLGEVAGYASLRLVPGSTTAAYHEMTAVRPAFRGLGLATALKRATIGWAIEHGLEELRTGNDELNAPMRAINARLGYRPLPDFLALQGPLARPR